MSGDTLIPPEQPPLRRIDGLDTLRSNLISRLEYEFDIPADFPVNRLGDYDILGRISLDNGTLVRTSLPLASLYCLQQCRNIFYITVTNTTSSSAPDRQPTRKSG